MKIITLAGMTGFFLMLFVNPVFTQTEQQIQKLNELSIEFEREFTIQKAEAIRLADSLGIPVRIESDARTAELMFFENGIPVYNTTFNAGGAALINSDKVYPGGLAGLSLSGAGQTLGIWDAGRVRLTHQEFSGRVTQIDGSPTNHFHATHVAGTMIAAGVDPAAKGMSYAANLHAYDWNNDASEMATAAAGGLKVSQHSYGTISGWYPFYGNWYWYGDINISTTEDYGFGFYSPLTRSWDEIAHNAPEYLIVKSAGNDRGQGPAPGSFHYYWDGINWIGSTATRQIDGGANGYDCIPYRGNAKNILTVGAVTASGAMSSFSSWGPTDDGRVKPDVVAKGVNVYSTVELSNSDYGSMNGTSMSGPMISGSVGLLLQHQQDLHPGVELLSSTIKGLIIHSADDNISGAPGPDYRFGWGLMDTDKAAYIMSQNKLAGNIYIYELTLGNGGEILLPFKAAGGEPLRATLVWNDVPGNPPPASLNPTTSMLMNDLDLRIEDVSSNIFSPYILNPANPSAAPITGDNFRDNVEMVHIDSPVPEMVYTIKITHKGTLSGGSQQLSLIISGNMLLSNFANPSTLYAFAAGSDMTDLNWTKNPNNDNVMLAWSANAAFGVPVNGTIYSPGQTIPGGGTVLYRGSNTTYMHTGLNSSTTYFYKAFSYNASDEYSPGLTANATTDCGTVTVLPFSENFNASTSLPPCWEIDDHIGNGQVWQFGTHANGLTGTSGNYAFLNSDGYGSGNSQNSDLVTPMMDLTNYTDVTLSFTHHFEPWSGTSGSLYYSINDGESWIPIQSWTSTFNPSYFSQMIPQVASESQVRFKWNYSGTWGYYWDVDDISVTGTETIPAVLTLAGVTIPSGTHCFGATQTITTGDGAQHFSVAPGGIVDLVAGQNIIMLPGTQLHSGANVNAWIAPAGPFCPVLASSLLTEDLNEAEIQEQMTVSGKDNFFGVFPNPATEGFTLKLEVYDDQEVIVIEVYSIMGERMLNRELPAGPRHYVGLEEFKPGIYLVRLMHGKQTGVERIIKQN